MFTIIDCVITKHLINVAILITTWINLHTFYQTWRVNFFQLSSNFNQLFVAWVRGIYEYIKTVNGFYPLLLRSRLDISYDASDITPIKIARVAIEEDIKAEREKKRFVDNARVDAVDRDTTGRVEYRESHFNGAQQMGVMNGKCLFNFDRWARKYTSTVFHREVENNTQIDRTTWNKGWKEGTGERKAHSRRN